MAVSAGTAFVRFEGDFAPLKKQARVTTAQVSRQLSSIKANPAASAGFKRQGETLRELGRAARFAAGGAALLGGVAVVNTIKVAANFEQQMSRLGAVSGATARQMAILKRQALAAGAATKFSALDAAAAQTELAKGGLSTAQIMGGGLKAALGLAAAGEIELAEAARFAVNAIKLFGLEGKQAENVADALATAANKTTADVGDFGLALAQGGGAAKAAGLSFHETVTALEALAEGGVRSADAGTSLKSALTNLNREAARAKMKELGLDFFDAAGNMIPLVNISAQLRDKLGGLTREQRLQAIQTIAGTDGMRTFLSLYDAGPEKIAKFERQLKKQGTATDIAKQKQDNFAGALENFKGSIETLQVSIGTQALPALTSLAKRATEVTNVIARIADRKDLDFGEKLAASWKAVKKEFGADVSDLNIGENLGKAISLAIPVIAEAAAAAAPRVVKAFVDAWINSSVWGRLVIGGFLLHKLGGLAAFRALGARGGTAFGGGFAATSGAAMAKAGAPAAGGFGRGFLLAARANAPAIGIGLAALFGPEIAKAINGPGVQERLQTALKRVTAGGAPDRAGFDKFLSGIGESLPETERKVVEQVKRVRRVAIDAFGKGAKLKLEVAADPAKAIRQLNSIKTTFTQFEHGWIKGIDNIKAASSRTFRAIAETIGTHSAVGRRAVQRNFDLTLDAISKTMRRGLGSAQRAMPAIKTLLSHQSGLGRDAIRRNFADVREIIQQTMSRGGQLTRQGMQAMVNVMMKELLQLGLHPKDVPKLKNINKRQPRARGGLVQFGRSGDAGPDNIPVDFGAAKITVGSGEVGAVFNRHQLPVVNERLRDYGGLPGFFNRVRKPHSHAEGGLVDKGRRLFGIGGMIRAADRLEKAHFPYVWGGGHSATPAPFGPMDCSGAVSFVLQHGGVKIPTMVSGALAGAGKPGPGAVTVFANAGHTLMRIGRRFFGTSGTNPGGGAGWMPDPGPGYLSRFAVRHFGTGGDDFAGGAVEIPRQVVEGDGLYPQIIQGRLDQGRKAIQAKLDSVAGAAGGGDVGDPGPGGDFSKAQLRKLWIEQGGAPMAANLAAAVALAESGGRSDASNNNSNGSIDRGLWQINSIHGRESTFDPEANARAAIHISSNGTNWNPWVAYKNGNYRQHLEKGGPVGGIAQLFELAKGGLVGSVQRTLKRVAKGKTKRAQAKSLKPLIDKIKAIGLPKQLTDQILSLDKSALRFNEFATRAQAISTEGEDGVAAVTGVVAGGDEKKWLQGELETLFSLRNRLIEARDGIIRRRTQVAQSLGEARKELKKLSREGHTPRGWKGTNPAIGSISSWNSQKDKKRLARVGEWRSKGGKLPGDREFSKDGKINPKGERQKAAIKKVIPALKASSEKLVTGQTDNDDLIGAVQGEGPLTMMKNLPALGVFGGRIFTAQQALQELTNKKAQVTDTSPSIELEKARGDLLQKLLTEANLRTAVSERHFRVLRDFPAFGGSFATGGVVPGATGEPRTIIAHGGETITPPGKAGTTQVTLVVEDGAVDTRKIRAIANDETQVVIRHEARAGARMMPGRPGVLK